jgi:hypothetical protein
MLYLAYGMNTNVAQMASRCPGSVSIGRVDIPDYRLVFRGVADIEESYGDTLQCVLWDITADCEVALDMLEGYPSFYGKEYVDVTFGNKTYTAMIYKMIGRNLSYSSPNIYYQEMLEDGYADHGLDLDQIYEATGFAEVEDTLDYINRRYAY